MENSVRVFFLISQKPNFKPIMPTKWSKSCCEILQQMLKDFQHVFDHLWILGITGLDSEFNMI